MLLKTIKSWPASIYDISAVIVAVQAELDRVPSSSKSTDGGAGTVTPDAVVLMECLAELYVVSCSNLLDLTLCVNIDILRIVNPAKHSLSSYVSAVHTSLILFGNTTSSLPFRTRRYCWSSLISSSWPSGGRRQAKSRIVTRTREPRQMLKRATPSDYL
jgi:hypothetical protein